MGILLDTSVAKHAERFCKTHAALGTMLRGFLGHARILFEVLTCPAFVVTRLCFSLEELCCIYPIRADEVSERQRGIVIVPVS